MDNKLDIITQIRGFNRFYTNILGLLDNHILESNYSLTEVRVLLEINNIQNCTANTLVNNLRIDRSYMSRIIKHLEADKLITKHKSKTDSRINYILLTEKGENLLRILEEKSNNQIESLIQCLNKDEITKVLDAMKLIKYKFSEIINPINIRNFTSKDVDFIISRHRSLYSEEYNLSPIFGDYVEKGLHNFEKNYDNEKECMLICTLNKKIIGSIVICKTDEKTAQLRYFLLEPEARGRGLGHKLVDMALDFSKEKGYKYIFLETISVLKAARHIYASKGFKITSTHENSTWGKDILEERWELIL